MENITTLPPIHLQGTSKNLLRVLIAALGGARNPHPDLSGLRFLRSIRLALRPLMTLFRGALQLRVSPKTTIFIRIIE
jgi:hypothetical protein